MEKVKREGVSLLVPPSFLGPGSSRLPQPSSMKNLLLQGSSSALMASPSLISSAGSVPSTYSAPPRDCSHTYRLPHREAADDQCFDQWLKHWFSDRSVLKSLTPSWNRYWTPGVRVCSRYSGDHCVHRLSTLPSWYSHSRGEETEWPRLLLSVCHALASI